MLLKRILPFFIALLISPFFITAQITSSSMTGVVRDVDGQTLTGATISAVHQPTGTKYTTVSRGKGEFNITNMRVGGPYIVEITFVGHTPQRYDNINLNLAETYVLNTNLEKTSASLQNVVVTAPNRNSILNANRTGASTLITRNMIERTPSISRNINDLVRATPQANGTSIGGGNYRQNYITVDGSDFNNTFGIGTNLPAGGAPISLDALENISVNVTPYDIRQSGFIGSAINAVTRSGTNDFSGSVYTYWRSDRLQGDKLGDNRIIKPAFNFKQYGARVGFPIIQDKLFLFLSYETESRPKQVSTRTASSASSPYSPTTNSGIARPSADDLNMISQYLIKTYGYDPGAFQNYVTSVQNEKFLVRLDWNINSKNRFNIRYNQVEGGEPFAPSTSRSPMTAYTTGAGRTDINALWFQNSNYFQGANFYSLSAELNSTIGRRFANTLRGTYTFQNDSRQSTSTIFPFVDILSGGTPYTSFGYEPFTSGNLRKVKTYSVVDNFTLALNKNLITLGAQADFSTTINGFQRFATSYYTFNSWSDFVNGVKPLDFGITYSLSPGYAQAFPTFKFAQYSFYAQDEISASKNLKITAGIRADNTTYPGVEEIKTHPLVAAVTFANGETINTGNLPKSKVLLSPRVGFNWDIYGDRSLQIRGGTGIFTGRIPFVWIVSQSGDAGLLQVTSTYETLGAARTAGNPANYITPGPFNPNPAAYLPATQPVAGTVIPSTIDALARNFKFPQTWKTSLAFDKKISTGVVFTLEGILNNDLNAAYFTNPNLVTPAPLNVAGYPDNRLIYPSTVTNKFINPLTAANAATNPSTAVPSGDARGTQSLNAIVLHNISKGYYGSLTAKLEKQFGRGLFGVIAYTASIGDNYFDGSGDQPLSAWQATATVNGSNNPVLSQNGNIVPGRIIASVSYRKEYLQHLATTVSLEYEGSIQGRFSYTYSADFNRDGTNLDLIYIPTDATDPNQITFVSKTVNGVTYDATTQGQMFNQYIDQDKYLSKHRGQYAERNGAKYPWHNDVDVKLVQDVFVNVGAKKRNSIQLSLDIFNLGNLINKKWGAFQTPNASSILVPTNVSSLVAGGAVKPTFQIATVGNGLATTTFRDVVTIASTYYMQFGLRYIFN